MSSLQPQTCPNPTTIYTAMCGSLPRENYRHGVPSAKQLSNAVGQNRWLELLLWPPSTMTSMTIGPNLLTPCPLNGWMKKNTVHVNQICWVAAQFKKVESPC